MKTLFVSSKLTVEQFKGRYGLNASEQFFDCADGQLTSYFESQTGLKSGKHLSISLPMFEIEYERGEISKILLNIFVNHNWNPVTMLWKSKSGRIYSIDDTDIDCNDIEFWFEGLDPLLYHQQLYPNDKLPFKLKNLTYELVITRLVWEECSMDMYVKEEDQPNALVIMKRVDDFINAFNEKSVNLDRKFGVIHNWKRRLEDDKLVYEIDTGSAGSELLKKLLPFLSKMNCFSMVEIW